MLNVEADKHFMRNKVSTIFICLVIVFLISLYIFTSHPSDTQSTSPQSTQKSDTQSASSQSVQTANQGDSLDDIVAAMKRDVLSGKKEITNSIGMKFVLIPAGHFMMGPKDKDPFKISSNEIIKSPFYIQISEVSQRQWCLIMDNNSSRIKGDDLPVNNVPFEEIMVFIKKLKARERTGEYALPTEQQWEYASRAGTKTNYYFGDNFDLLSEYAWFKDNSGGRPHPIMTKKPNNWGVYDMYGNVWEWCKSWYPVPYSTDANGAEYELSRISHGEHTAGGGSAFSPAKNCRSISRSREIINEDTILVGFRLVLNP